MLAGGITDIFKLLKRNFIRHIKKFFFKVIINQTKRLALPHANYKRNVNHCPQNKFSFVTVAFDFVVAVKIDDLFNRFFRQKIFGKFIKNFTQRRIIELAKIQQEDFAFQVAQKIFTVGIMITSRHE